MSPKRSGRAPCIDSAQKLRISVCSKCGSEQKVLNGAYLRARREARNLSLRTVARLAHLSAAFLSDVENNRRNASDRALLAYVYAGIIDSSMLR
jgi:DNA-binding transcriptional regulator YiaG